MRFIKKDHNCQKINDNVFAVSSLAKKAIAELGKDVVINATIGSLYDDEGRLVAYHSIYETFNALENNQKAAYASGIKGNETYLKEITSFVVAENINIPTRAIATIGGTGAISCSIKNCTNPHNTILLPEIAWSSYRVMAEEYNLNVLTYDIYDLNDLILKARQVAEKEGQVFLIINSPCHNPCGLSYRDEEWKDLIEALNEIAINHPVILLNDIAYIDYAYDLKKSRHYMQAFNQIHENVLVLIAYSTSKAFTAYGQRLGTLFIVHQDETLVQDLADVFEKSARVLWSNANNGMMLTIAQTLKENEATYLKEKDFYIDLLKKRSETFIQEATRLNIPFYPYQEGFFITLKLDNKKRDDLHQKLIDHHVYTVKVHKGLRIGLCSTPVNKIVPLLQIVKDLWDGQE